MTHTTQAKAIRMKRKLKTKIRFSPLASEFAVYEDSHIMLRSLIFSFTDSNFKI